jgi:putative PIN family toxin of toxin-antitoxin system
MTRVVLDTNVLIAALRSRNGASFKLLSLVGTGSFDTVVSVPLVFEYEYAATKTAKQVGLDLPAIGSILDYVCKVSLHQDIFFLWRPILRDPSDDMVLEVAVASSADGIVTFNKKDFGKADSFDLSIWTPKEFLKQEGLI